MERPGHDAPRGVGEIRILRTLFIEVREEIVELVPNERVGYRLLSGLPLSNYLGETDLHPLPSGGTRITWQATFDVKSDSTAWFWRLFMRAVLTDFTRRLAKASGTCIQ